MGGGTFVGFGGNAESCNMIEYGESAVMDMAIGIKGVDCLVGETLI
jgi:hypothetical protein